MLLKYEKTLSLWQRLSPSEEENKESNLNLKKSLDPTTSLQEIYFIYSFTFAFPFETMEI